MVKSQRSDVRNEAAEHNLSVLNTCSHTISPTEAGIEGQSILSLRNGGHS